MKYFVDYLPVTTDNDLRLYIDGQEYCADLYADLRAARSFVFLTGLHFMAGFRLIRTGAASDAASSLVNVLAELGKRGVKVFLLVNQFWKDESEVAGKFAPIRKKIMKAGELYGYLPETYKLFHALRGFKNIHCRTDIHTNSDIFGTNHQKTIVIDDKIAYLGGIDLTFLDGDRWDTQAHRVDLRAVDRTQKFWHDVHMRVVGPAVQFVRDNFVQRWTFGRLHTLSKNSRIDATADKKRPPLPTFATPAKSRYRYPSETESADKPMVQIVRSMPHKKNWHSEKPAYNLGKSDWEHSCKDAYLIGIRAAKKYIYLENQWIADEDIWAELAAAAKRNKNNPDFRIILMVPYEGLFAAGLGSNQELFIGAEMEDVIDASYSDATFGMYSLVQSYDKNLRSAQIYVHSKILIVDDEWALIGSANAGGISLEGIRSGRDEPDTELSAIILDREFVTRFRRRLWEEHLGQKVSAAYQAREADHFRRLAGKRYGSKVRFFPDYDKIKRGKPTWWPITPSPKTLPINQFRKTSRIIPSFSDRLRWNLPVMLFKAAFKVYVFPAPPAGYRCWYRWKAELFYNPPYISQPRRTTVNLRLLSLKYDKDEVWGYSDQDTVYVGAKTAKYIDDRVKTVERGRIVCRVQLVPLNEGPDPDNINFPSMVLDYECLYINAKFAKHNIDLSLIP